MLPGCVGPLRDAEGLLLRLDGGGDQRGVGQAIEAFVTRGVVAVRVGVGHDEWDGVAVVALQPFRDQLLRDGGGVARARAGVHEQGAVTAEEEVEEGLFVVGAAGFAEDVEIGIVFVDLPIGNLQAVGAAGDPRGGERAGFHGGRSRLGRLGEGRGGAEKCERFEGHRIPKRKGAGECSPAPSVNGLRVRTRSARQTA